MKFITFYLVSLSFAIVVFYAVAAVYFPQLYIFATYEDMYGEWGQAFFFLATFIFSTLNAINSATGRYRWFFMLLALASFYTFMEEISWGQRLLGYDTPEFFAKHSYQDEANLHNLLTGPVESWTKTALTYLITLGLIGYGVIFPIALKMQWKPALWLAQLGVVAPPLALLPAFLFGGLFELELFSFNEAEVAELLVAMAMSFTALNFWLQQHQSSPSKRLLYFMVTTVVVLVAAFITTQTLLHNPRQKAEITHRLANGYDKFADRYERYDHYLAVAKVLQYYDQLKPDNTVVLRRIADNYELLGNPEKAREFLYRAIEVGLKRVNKDPDNVPANISLAKSYHRVKRPEKVYFYGAHAYDIALQRYQEADNNRDKAYWAYWLAKACEQVNKQPEALKYFRRAYKLDPDNYRYERAYYQKRHLMENYYDEDWAERLYSD
ncbi:tetratricopeptide repeat protein [methane-oxidizing endosymbiont of Gigantopelta aegis]|uniref:tetratricopeptide repeat protein n=1 Tax=methane-oxidizing endosymbiont of Gigantopelta aegis TaxID=2794938 RepID=UPI0018DB6017|nr:tetratricopeptide repeat protein [methane-oxidizing endosymbiont of Gigantopelta aegis]